MPIPEREPGDRSFEGALSRLTAGPVVKLVRFFPLEAQKVPKTNVALFSATGRLLPVEMPIEMLERHANHFTVVRNRRGYLTRAYVKRVVPLDDRPASPLGLAFRQHLECGSTVWALRKVRGSR